MHYTYNIDVNELIVTLPGNILVPYKWLQLLNRLPHLREIAQEGTVHVAAYFSTSSGMSSWSLLILVGIDDAEEHGIPGMNAGHLHLSVRHSVHNSGCMS